jgi:enediyne biosynthesis protein E4
MPLATLCISVLLFQFSFLVSALEWKSERGFRYAQLTVSANGKAGFAPFAPSVLGITFSNQISEGRGLTNHVYMNGTGVALGDIDGDDLPDIYFCGVDSANQLYRNLGNWRFTNITVAAGVSCGNQPSSGAVFADVDGDGDLDLLVSGIGSGVRLFLNDGQGKFREATSESGLKSDLASMSMALADIDGDGDLDLYVANYGHATIQDEPGLRFRVSTKNGVPTIIAIKDRAPDPEQARRFSIDPETMAVRENGEADVLYLNDGRGHFTPASWGNIFSDENGRPMEPPYDWGLAAMFHDINGDGVPDLYVCNDNQSPDRIWINDGRGKFKAISSRAIRETSFSSMGVDFADINRDGFDDFFVVDMLFRAHVMQHQHLINFSPPARAGQIENRPQYSRNTLFLNRGDGTFAEIAQLASLEASDWSWSPIFLDVDLDGYEDLIITTGLERSLRNADLARQMDTLTKGQKLSIETFQKLRQSFPRLQTPNYAFRNRGDLSFEDRSNDWHFNSTEVCHGMALADLDNDGDLDVVINCLNARPLIYRNDSPAPRLAIQLKGKAPNTRGIGAKIRVFASPSDASPSPLNGERAGVTGENIPMQSQEVISGGRYLSCDDGKRVFATGSFSNNLSVQITWRNGTQTTINNVLCDRLYEFEESNGSTTQRFHNSPIQTNVALFADMSQLLSHRHTEAPFNDFERQPLLPKKLGQLGPGICWADVDGNGWDDLLIGSGRGGEIQMFLNREGKAFGRVGLAKFTGDLPDDVTTILVRPTESGNIIMFGVANYESGAPASVVRQFEIWAGGLQPKGDLSLDSSSIGPMAMADVDGDGRLDLFVGGRVMPGRYPEPAKSHLFRGSEQGFMLDDAAEKVFAETGLVSGALFSDLDNDGFPELILASEWGPLRIFHNDHGRFTERTDSLGFHRAKGWWNGIAAGDFDGDGKMDLIASNWGRNTKYHRFTTQPAQLFYADLRKRGTIDLIEAHFEPSLNAIVPWRSKDALLAAFPFLAERVPTFNAYSTLSVSNLVGEDFSKLRALDANTFDTSVFLNRGDYFERVSLPLEAQLAPAFGVNVADFDGDGIEDIFLSQNFFAVDAETSRYAAGRGLLLRGEGRGKFKPLPASESGIAIYGEQRGSAVGDFDADGRVDLVVSQSGAETKLFRNTQATPGVRVRLIGPPQNPWAVGAVLRIVSDGQYGAAREIQAGSGYWSQDSPVEVLAAPNAKFTQLWVRWPGGRTNIVDFPPNVRQISLSQDNMLKVKAD